MNGLKLKNMIQDGLQSGTPILYIISEDDERAVDYVREYFRNRDKEVIIYDPATNFSCDREEQHGDTFNDIVSDWLEKNYLKSKQLILRDFHRNLDDIYIISAIKQIIRECKNTQIVIISNMQNIPKELEHYISVIVAPLPDGEEIKKILGDFSGNEKIYRAAQGLEEIDIRQIVRQIKTETNDGKKQEELFYRKKANIVNKTGILSIEVAIEDDTNLGGYKALKSWLEIQKEVLNKKPELMAKGMLLLGITGCGKSLCAKVTAGKLHLPLIRMEFGKILNKYVGESEENLYKALRIVEAMAPCVLWLDEFEKAISVEGHDNTNANIRLIGIFLTWMQERKGNVFIVATVNNVSKLPPELLRRGRFDKIYYVDVPDDDERKEIFKIHAKKLGINVPGDVVLSALSNKLAGYSGSDIEYILQEAKRMQIYQKSNGDEVYKIIEQCIQNTHPISIMLGEEVNSMRTEFTRRRFENVNGSSSFYDSNVKPNKRWRN